MMTKFLQPLVVALTIVAFVSAAPPRNAVGRFEEPSRGYFQPQYYDPFETSEILNYRPRQDNSLVRYDRTGLDSLSGATFGQSKKYDPSTLTKGRTIYSKSGENLRKLDGAVPKRNFDEIDRTNFDSFVKKNEIVIPKHMPASYGGNNFDEIDNAFGGNLIAY